MTGPVTTEALVDGDHDMPTEAEVQAMREEAENFRLPAPPPTPVRGRFYLTGCEYCGWVGSSEHCGGNCGPDDDDIVCPVCCSSICGDAPDEADTAKHGEAVYQRIVAAEAERDAALAAHQQVTAERDEARARADGDLAAGNDELRSLGTFDRKMKVGKHQATNRVHLRSVIAALDEAGLSDAADTLIWQAWHRVNSVARAHEFLRLANAEQKAAEAALAQAEEVAKDRALNETVERAVSQVLSWTVTPEKGARAGMSKASINDRNALVSNIAASIQALSPATATADVRAPSEDPAAASWPSGCIKPNACSRHRTCVYAMSAEKCRHFGQDLGPAIKAVEAARAATAREGKADADRA